VSILKNSRPHVPDFSRIGDRSQPQLQSANNSSHPTETGIEDGEGGSLLNLQRRYFIYFIYFILFYSIVIFWTSPPGCNQSSINNNNPGGVFKLYFIE
jgi:hypothetical protein